MAYTVLAELYNLYKVLFRFHHCSSRMAIMKPKEASAHFSFNYKVILDKLPSYLCCLMSRGRIGYNSFYLIWSSNCPESIQILPGWLLVILYCTRSMKHRNSIHLHFVPLEESKTFLVKFLLEDCNFFSYGT